MRKTAVTLLSGGLDSAVSLGLSNKKYDIKLALTFDYGQKAFNKELKSSQNICKYYGIEHKFIKIDFLKKFSSNNIPNINMNELENKSLMQKAAQSLWIPNRNGLFVNIAATFADELNIDYIILGANKEEADTFPDNSEEFIIQTNNALKFSTSNQVQLIAPLVNMTKVEIIKKALDIKFPLEIVYSCYNNKEKHCGKCPSCQRLKRALIQNKENKLIEKLFEE